MCACGGCWRWWWGGGVYATTAATPSLRSTGRRAVATPTAPPESHLLMSARGFPTDAYASYGAEIYTSPFGSTGGTTENIENKKPNPLSAHLVRSRSSRRRRATSHWVKTGVCRRARSILLDLLRNRIFPDSQTANIQRANLSKTPSHAAQGAKVREWAAARAQLNSQQATRNIKDQTS